MINISFCNFNNLIYSTKHSGGVELHILSLAAALTHLGHHAVVMTPAIVNSPYHGIQYLCFNKAIIKVYYLPVPAFSPVGIDSTFPTLCSPFPYFRGILLRERINILHGHATTSTSMQESFVGSLMLRLTSIDIKTVLTEHSLYGFGDVGAIHLNKIMKISLSCADHFIAVSDTCRENLILRADLDPKKVSTIPNAVDPVKFSPFPSNDNGERDTKSTKMIDGKDKIGKDNEDENDGDVINVIVISRLAFRKGVDLLVRVIPICCKKYKTMKFIIGGDGPKRLLLDEMVERYQLYDRVELLGEVPHEKVPEVLRRGSIFLNCSLTESFCMAILEAACCGLFVVSTEVGGVPEVLPEDMIRFPKSDSTSPEELVDALGEAIEIVKRYKETGIHDKIKLENHRKLTTKYNWKDIALETEKVYKKMLSNKEPLRLREKFDTYSRSGKYVGSIGVIVMIVNIGLLVIIVILEKLSEIIDSVELVVDEVELNDTAERR